MYGVHSTVLPSGTASGLLRLLPIGYRRFWTQCMNNTIRLPRFNSTLVSPATRRVRVHIFSRTHEQATLKCAILARSRCFKPVHGHQSFSYSNPGMALIAKNPENRGRVPHYHPPERGLLSCLPAHWVPYAELMRLDKPAGLYLFYFPYLFGTLYGVVCAEPVVTPSTLLVSNVILLAGTVIMRGATCSWNDNVDRDFDRQVARCCLRPIARGAITPRQANIFTGVQSLVGLGMLALLPVSCTYYAVPIIALLGFYPFAKRLFNYPQVVLGFPMSWAIFMGMSAVNTDPHTMFMDSNLGAVAAMACFYVSNIAWTVIYDTIYAHQDVRDDSAAGVKSIAVHWRERTKFLLAGLAVTQVTLLVATGALTGLGPWYYTASCGGTAASLVTMIYRVDLTKPSDCMWWFKNGAWLVGGSITAGLFGEYLQRLTENEAGGEVLQAKPESNNLRQSDEK